MTEGLQALIDAAKKLSLPLSIEKNSVAASHMETRISKTAASRAKW